MHNFSGGLDVGHSYSIQGGGGQKKGGGGGGGKGYSQNSGRSWLKRGRKKNAGGFGPWIKLCHKLSIVMFITVVTMCL